MGERLIDLVRRLRDLEVTLAVRDGKLRVDAPSGVLTEELQEAIREHKQDLMEVVSGGGSRPGLERRSPAAARSAPLTHAQEILWLFQGLLPESTVYNVSTKVQLRGPLDVGRLEQAVQRLLSRHEPLRSTFVREGEQLRQIPRADPVLDIEFLDVVELPEREQVDALRRLVAAQQRTPFDLANDLPLRLGLLRRGPERHDLVATFHHIAFDGSSILIFYQDLLALYAGAELPELPIEYGDFAAWERSSWDEERGRREVKYWMDHLEGVPREFHLPNDFPRPAEPSFGCGVATWTIDGEAKRAIDRLAASKDVSLFTILMTVLAATLKRYSSQSDFAILTPVSGRIRPEVRRQVGMFVNQLPMRVTVDDPMTFEELLEQVRVTVREGLDHQEVPYGRLLREFGPRRDRSQAQTFQVMLNVLPRVSEEIIEAGDLRCVLPDEAEIADILERQSDFDLDMSARRADDGIHLDLVYNDALFEAETAQRILHHFVDILTRAAADPETEVAELGAVPQAQRELLLNTWNDTASDYPGAICLPQLVEAQAERTPQRAAVHSDEGGYDYAELVERARRIAAGLAEAGVQPGDRVGVLMHRSHDMIAGLLGIMGAGAAYVPLDPKYPAARVKYVAEDSEMAALITSAGAAGPFGLETPTFDLDDWQLPPARPFRPVDPSSVAYVIYTSGSTGKPKGVEVPHHGVVNLLHAMRREPGLDESDTVLAITTISFDISVVELYLPLVVGARVVVADEEEVFDGRRLAQRIEQDGITLLQATPTSWKLLLSGGWQGDPKLRALAGGEPLSRQLADDLLARVRELWNGYGPTEATVYSTFSNVQSEGPIVIGRPVPNTTAYVLDDQQRLMPIGVPGELWVGGDSVAKGYVNLPQMTAERFVPSPFREGERLYRTGDLVRYRADGQIEHLGRQDNQVKVRGFRIELGEIEGVLSRLPEIADIAVVARESQAGSQLVAYVVYRDDADLTATEVRDAAAELLPAYMVPALVVALDELPRTPNGKVDRKALPEPFQRTAMAVGHYVAPATQMEQLIAGIWADLLSVERIGSLDQFFSLGGHSLLAMQAVERIETRTGQRVDPRLLFFQNLRQIADRVERSLPDEALRTV